MIQNEFSVPVAVDSIERSGTKKEIEANETERSDLAKRFDLIDIEFLKGKFKIVPASVVYHVTGTITGKISQASVATGEPIVKEISQDIDAYYTDYSRVTSFDSEKRKRSGGENSEDDHEIREEREEPESIDNGILDLGEVAAQFLGLALDNYPKAADESPADYIEVAPEDAKPNPFAVLKDLNVKK